MPGFVLRAAVAALGLWLASVWVDGLVIETPMTLLFAALLLGIVNALVRPVLILLTLPFLVLSLGLFLLVINATMLGLVAALLPDMRLDGFLSALVAALIVSVVSLAGSLAFGSTNDSRNR